MTTRSFARAAGQGCKLRIADSGWRMGITRIGLLRAVLPGVICAFASLAQLSAQFQMPDPKQMSGIPRPVDDLPAGSISVRLIRGSLSNNIAGHPVDLRVAGKVRTVKTDDNGRPVRQPTRGIDCKGNHGRRRRAPRVSGVFGS